MGFPCLRQSTGLALVAVVVLSLAAGCGDGAPVASGGGASTPSGHSAESSTTTKSLSAGTPFVDPQNTYTITVGPDWKQQPSAVVKEIENWTVAPSEDGFAPNVNVLTQAAPGMDLAEYMDFSAKHVGGIKLIDSSTVDGTNGNKLGLLEFAGTFGTNRALHSLATVDVRNDQAVVATFTAPEDAFAGERPDVQPYLLTLQAT